MVRAVYIAALFAVVLCDPVKKQDHAANVDFLKKQVESMLLFFHIEELNHEERCMNISKTWSLEDNIDNFKDTVAVQRWVDLWKRKWQLPRHAPFSALEKDYSYEISTIFNILHSAKDYDTFYKAAVYLRDRTNEDLFIYVLTAVVIHRTGLQGFFIPPIYEVLSQYFINGKVTNIAQKIKMLGDSVLKDYPSVYKKNKDFVIKWSSAAWPYYSKSASMAYFTHDQGLTLFYYYFNLGYPSWLGGDIVPLAKDGRGEWFWFIHKQIVTRYYMERLSNGLGEIENLDDGVVEEGYNSGLIYPSGIPFPVRPNHFKLSHPEVADKLIKIQNYERRIRDAIDSGFFINTHGEPVAIRNPERIDVLANIIQANVDSPNPDYYKDFISIWKSVLGNSDIHVQSYLGSVPLVLPSALEHFQTALRDPAFFMIWKRVLNLFTSWQETLVPYTKQDLECHSVSIENVDVDKLVTYFDYTYMNISAILPRNEVERKYNFDDTSVAVQYPRLNHQEFAVRIHVKSEVAKKVVVWFYLAPQYDGNSRNIPMHENWQNFFLFDQFIYDLPLGDSVITRKSTNNQHTEKDWKSASEVYVSALRAIEGNGTYNYEDLPRIGLFPRRLVLPKGRAEGMPFQFVIYISDYKEHKVPFASTFDPLLSTGFGSGSRKLTDDPLGFPFDRPMTGWYKELLPNFYEKRVIIYHESTLDINVPYTF